MKILITGGAGFIGSHLIQRLLESDRQRIVCLDNFNDYYDPRLKRANAALFAGDDRVTVVEQDFCDPARIQQLFELHKFEIVVHLGAYAGVRVSVEQPALYARNNVEGTTVLLEAARRYPVERFILASSSTVYGKGAEIPFREDSALGVPASPYGATKRAAELMGMTYLELHNVPVVCVRPFSVYGPRLRPDLALSIFTDRILRGQELPLYGDGTIRRDMTHVSDICDGLRAAMTADQAVGQCINLGHSEPIEMLTVIHELSQAAGIEPKIKFLPAREEDLPVTFADLERAARILGFQPKIAFSDGAQEFVTWYRQWHQL